MEKLLAVAGLAQKIYGRYLFRRLLSGVIVVTGLTIITALMVSAVVIGGFYALYFALQHHGIEPEQAMLIAGGLFTLATAVLVMCTVLSLRRLRDMPRTLLRRSSVTARAEETINAFLNGLMAEDIRQ